MLVALALPALDLYLGQQDNGALPRSTDARRAFDGMTAAFGPGANGPLLISVDLSAKPAAPDQKNLDKLSTDEQDNKDKANKQATAKEQQIAGGLEAQGVPPAQAQQQAQGAGPARARQAARQDQAAVGRQAQAARAAGDRPAAAGPQEGDQARPPA